MLINISSLQEPVLSFHRLPQLVPGDGLLGPTLDAVRRHPATSADSLFWNAECVAPHGPVASQWAAQVLLTVMSQFLFDCRHHVPPDVVVRFLSQATCQGAMNNIFPIIIIMLLESLGLSVLKTDSSNVSRVCL